MKIMALISALAVLSQVAAYNLSLGNLYYFLFTAMLVILTSFSGRKKMNFKFVLLWISCLLSIIFNDIPSFFQPYERFFAFTILVLLIGPFISNIKLYKFRIEVWNLLNYGILIMIFASFFGILAGLPEMLDNGGYSGFFNHSMTLGPFSGIGLLIALNLFHESKQKKHKLLFITLASIAFILCIGSGSRAAVIATIFALLGFYYIIYQNRVALFFKYVLFISIVTVMTFPLWKSYSQNIQDKMSYSMDNGGLTTTRESLWNMRIKEFNSSPIIGVGFAAVDPDISTKFNKENGKIEPGSSWLAILSMVGLIGFIPFCLLYLKKFRLSIKYANHADKSELSGALIIFFGIHFLAEGYVFSAGSGLFFYFWLVMGSINKNSKNLKILT